MDALALFNAALFCAGRPLTEDELLALLSPQELARTAGSVASLLQQLQQQAPKMGLNLVKQPQGWRYQTAPELADKLAPLFAERPARMSRAQWETLAIIAWQQPVTRGQIEDIRGVALSSGTLRSLLDYEWIEVQGQQESPGRPSLYGTTAQFLADFGLSSLQQLPNLSGSDWQQQELPVEATQMRFSDLLAKHLQLQQQDDSQLFEQLSQDLQQAEQLAEQGSQWQQVDDSDNTRQTEGAQSGPAATLGQDSQLEPETQDSIIKRMLAEQQAWLDKQNRSDHES